MRLSDFAEDTRLHDSGAPITMGDAVFYIRRWGTPAASKARKRVAMETFGPLHNATSDDELLIAAHWLVEFGVARWEGVKTVTGEPLEYSERNARAVFLAPEYRFHGNLVDQLVSASMRYENYLFEDTEEAIEELKKS